VLIRRLGGNSNKGWRKERICTIVGPGAGQQRTVEELYSTGTQKERNRMEKQRDGEGRLKAKRQADCIIIESKMGVHPFLLFDVGAR